MKNIKFIMTLFVAVAMFAGIGFVNAATPVTVGNAANNTFTITRTVSHVSNNVSNTFTYTITPDSNNPSGGATGVPTTATVVFTNQAPDAQTKTATQTGTINLSEAVFTKVGDYKYTVTETGSTDATNYPLASESYTIQVSVRFDTANPSQKVVTINAKDSQGTKLSTANLPFSSESQLASIAISKTVTGNMGDIEQYFKVKLNIAGTSGDVYTITGQSYQGQDVETTYTVGKTGDQYIYIKHGETVYIGKDGNDGQIRTGVTYSFTEDGTGEAALYETKINGSTTPSKSSGNLTVATTNSNTIVNDYDEPTMTGVFLKILPYVVIVAIAVAGIVYMVVRNNKQKLAEEE